MTLDFERLTAPEYLSDLTERPLDEVRSMRTECQTVENAFSLVRRVIHGRLDIVGGEIARRNEGRDVATMADFIEALPQLLADDDRPTGNPRPPQSIDPSEVADQLIGELDAEVGPLPIARLVDLDDIELAEQVVALDAHEQQLSRRRRAMHEIIDTLQADITRRYRTGEATVDSLLS